MKFTPSLAVLAFLIACGPAPELKRRLLKSAPDKLSDGRINLDNKSVSEVLQIKYNNEVNLECEFRAARPDKLIDDIEPKKLKWNLVNSPDKSQTMEFIIDDRILEVEITPTLSVFGKFTTPEKEGVYYKLQHTPVVDVTFRSLDNNIQKEEATARLFENIPGPSFVFRFEGMINLLSCSVKTVIAPQYEVEFEKIVKPKPATSPATDDQPSQASVNPSGQENETIQEGPATGTH